MIELLLHETHVDVSAGPMRIDQGIEEFQRIVSFYKPASAYLQMTPSNDANKPHFCIYIDKITWDNYGKSTIRDPSKN